MNTEQKVLQVAIEDIIPNRFQPRLAFDEEGLKELSESIKQHGIIQPLVLRRLRNKYEIIAGERRFKAATMAGLKQVPAIISDIDDNKSAEIALVENIQRRNLTPIEEAKSYKNLLDRGYMTQEQLAEKMGVSQSSIANKLRLLNLAPEVQDALLQEKISERHARSLLALPKEEQAEWLQKIISRRLTVRQLDLEIKKAKGENIEDVPLVNINPDMNQIVNNSNDINQKEPMKEVSMEPQTTQVEEIKQEEAKQVPNKFFNFLEDEAANMQMTEQPVNEEPNISLNNDIEVLEDLGSDPILNNNISTPEPQMQMEMPSLFSPDPSNVNNTIEEIKEEQTEKIIDPMDSVIKLDPNYKQIVEEAKGIDLKTAINEIRSMVESMEKQGFQMSLDEIDLTDKYQMTISIKKNE